LHLEQLKHSLCQVFSKALRPEEPNALEHPAQVLSVDGVRTEDVDEDVGRDGRVCPGSGVVDLVVPHEEQKRAVGLIAVPQLSQNRGRLVDVVGGLGEGLVKEGVLVVVKLAFRVIVEGEEVVVGATKWEDDSLARRKTRSFVPDLMQSFMAS